MSGKDVDFLRAPLRRPGAASHVFGLSLADAFKRFVLDDPLLMQKRQRIVEIDAYWRATLETGRFPNSLFGWVWPVKFEALQKKWRNRNVSDLANLAEEIRAAFDVLIDRYASLIELFRSGAVVVSGTFAANGDWSPIPQTQWVRSTAWVEIRDGDYCEKQRLKFQPMWKSLVIERARDVSATISASNRGRPGAPQTYPWDDIFDRLSLRFGNEGVPETQADLVAWVQEIARDAGAKEPDESTVRKTLAKRLPRTLAAAKQRPQGVD
jgi:hypothetical protein